MESVLGFQSSLKSLHKLHYLQAGSSFIGGVSVRMRFKGTVVADTSRSPYARMHPLPLECVRLEDSFWAPRLKILQKTTLPVQHQILEETGRLFNFRRAAGREMGDYRGLRFNDSDVYKWVEASAFSLAYSFDENLYRLTERVIEDIASAQDEDGYLNTYFTFELKGRRWTNLRDDHELYCAGHLIQAAIAYFRATGERRLLDVSVRFADHIYNIFLGRGRQGVPGHPEIEMALVELYRVSGDWRYLELASFFLDNRGRGLIGGGSYHIDHRPFRELSEIVGHAVRALYLNCGAADLYMELGDRSLWTALLRLWRSMVGRKMYVTGGVGSRYEGESFGEDYELPNSRAYAETCAAVANVMWNWRMLQASGDAKFTDILELALYNAVLSGISLDGKSYFYVNPLADRGSHRRQKWFECACCPPNVARLIASLPGYIYSVSNRGLWVHLYVQSVASALVDGKQVIVKQRTGYPWDGEVEVTVEPEKEDEFSLYLRIPGWCREAKLKVNQCKLDVKTKPGTYVEIHRTWSYGDVVSLSMAMPIEKLTAHPYVVEDNCRVALKRGPLVYCIEQADNPGFDVWNLILPLDSKLKVERDACLLGGVAVIRGEGLAFELDEFKDKLYTPVGAVELKVRPVRFKAIPYYAWANREPGPMEVWIRCADKPFRFNLVKDGS